jgi:hypothetical protein
LTDDHVACHAPVALLEAPNFKLSCRQRRQPLAVRLSEWLGVTLEALGLIAAYAAQE